ncbi:MAG: divalent-cation tolerance protein CutA [Candidatus Kariarchaeaceae archaeon]|jgi:periplasmic divalent cation tolerance protein
MPTISLIQTTVDDKSIATKLITGLLEVKLIACAQTTIIESSYWWNDNLDQTKEFSIIFKLPVRNKDKVIEYIAATHSYDVPEILIEDKLTSQSYYQYCLDVCN